MARKRRKASATVDIATVQWDTSTEAQRAARKWRLTERGEICPTTGKLLNPNGVRGIRFAAHLEELAELGAIDDRHLDAAEQYEALVRKARGSPAQRSCLDNSPIGYGDNEPNLRAMRELAHVQRRVGMIGSNLLDRATWAREKIPPRLHRPLRDALELAAEWFGC